MNYYKYNNSRRSLTAGESRKRKEREEFNSSTRAKPLIPSTPVTLAVSGAKRNPVASRQQPLSSNRLLAGYMAYEFLTMGTLFGQKFYLARAEAVPVNSAEVKRKRLQNPVQLSSETGETSGKSMPVSYAEVANILKSDGAHLPGVVNPTQLARWINM